MCSSAVQNFVKNQYDSCYASKSEIIAKISEKKTELSLLLKNLDFETKEIDHHKSELKASESLLVSLKLLSQLLSTITEKNCDGPALHTKVSECSELWKKCTVLLCNETTKRQHLDEQMILETVCQTIQTCSGLFCEEIKQVVSNSSVLDSTVTVSSFLQSLNDLISFFHKGNSNEEALEINSCSSNFDHLGIEENSSFGEEHDKIEIIPCWEADNKQVFEVATKIQEKIVASEELWITYKKEDSATDRAIENVVIKSSFVDITDLNKLNFKESDLPKLFAEIKYRLCLKSYD